MDNHHTSAIVSLQSWWPSSGKPALISGPCSVETPEQVMETAVRLAATGKVHILRGGIWKPRTRPDSFEGVGEKGIPWLIEAGRESGLPVMTEVATAEHVELCLKYGVDALWLGARTTVNPFSVQDIADSLQGVDIPVLVKNPINPDLQLWIGAIERLERAGIKKIAAIHRGFSHYGNSIYRNKPMWEIPIALKTALPFLNIICDPSHICGRRDLLAQVAQKALDLGMDGLMIESHITPDLAWSDASQQITPEVLGDLINALLVRSTDSANPELADLLQTLRSKIDKIDEEIIHLIGERMNLAKEIGLYKKDHNLTILQLDRWKEIVQTRTLLSEKLGLTPEFIATYLEQLHKESIRFQTRVMNSSGQ
jgi:chorismate mutase